MKIVVIICLLTSLVSCNNSFYILKKSDPAPSLSHAQSKDGEYTFGVSREPKQAPKSFLFTDYLGREVIINEAVKDENTGEMVSVRQLDEIVVTAKSQNISERNGVICLDFIVNIPAELQNSQWQINILPVLTRGKDTMHFNRIVLSGEEFKRDQDRGYKRYEKYLRSIIPDSADFLEVFTDLPNLTRFLERNLPDSRMLSGVKSDTLSTIFGVSEKQILDYYIKQWLIDRNNKKKADKEKIFEKFVKNPYLLGARLDSVIKTIRGDFLYHYSQEILTNENTSKLLLCLNGQVRDISGMSYTLESSDTLTYNVSSMISFIDTTKRYKKKIIERRATAVTAAYISFIAGKTNITDTLSNNASELDRIKKTITEVLSNEDFVLDSLILTASSSPEGPFAQNRILSNQRAASMVKYCRNFLIGINEEALQIQNLIISRSIPEDWEGLRFLITADSTIREKEKLFKCFNIDDFDEREKCLSKYSKEISYLREKLYPQLRRVTFSFNLHRRGMVKDTIHNTETDTLYMSGLRLLKERKYVDALSILAGYNDFNTAIAHISLGHDRSAEEILLSCTDSANKIYLLALLSARKGDEEQAVKYFLRAKGLNISMAYRGALDPEISSIIRKYNLNNDLFK